ncbi:unnamed protein product [Schistosoma curassoni]|uniref:Hist_deacetyl domain-containing protein n=1 Tax=Schistosoma curassoni TaxID=6186 RepID=A0A183K1Q5_9TREM|nr:unnamed protein product [Schistosoma curassoni]
MSGNTSDSSFPGSARRKNRNPLSDKDIPFIFTASDNSRHDPEPATDDLLTLYHQTEYVEQINQTTTMADNELKQLSATLDSVYFNKHTDLSARLSVGSWIQAIDLIHRGDVRNAFCLVRYVTN